MDSPASHDNASMIDRDKVSDKALSVPSFALIGALN
jgi:hypothetical protein